MAQKLKFGNGTWANKEGSTLAYNDEGNNYKPLPFSFSRDSIGTRVNKEGLIEVVGNNKPRIDYTDSADGVLLLENSATNLITYSSDLSVLSKVSVGSASSPVTTANYALAPDGTMTATRVVFDLNGGTTSQDRSILRQSISSGDYYLSIYVKSTNGTEQKVMWHDGGEFNTTTVTNQWKRITYDSRSGISNVGIALNGTSGVDTSDILVWGFQAEANSFPSSYIPTSGSTVQRAAETANGSGNSEVFNDSEGVLMVQTSILDFSTSDSWISISENSNINNNQFNLRFISNSNIIQAVSRANGLGQDVVLQHTINDKTAVNKISIKYKLNDWGLWVNGFEVDTETSSNAFTPNSLDVLDFDRGNNSKFFYGKTKEIAYYDTILTDLELEKLTSYRSLSELVTELNLNTL